MPDPPVDADTLRVEERWRAFLSECAAVPPPKLLATLAILTGKLLRQHPDLAGPYVEMMRSAGGADL